MAQTVGDRIVDARGVAKMETQAALAKATGIAPETISRYESGSYNPSLTALLMIANATGVRLEWLVTGEGPKKAKRRAA